MPDLATLSFAIDSSQAQRAIGVLETLKASSISVTQATNQQTTSFGNLTEAYSRNRDQLGRLVEQTKAYDGTLQGLATRLNALRESMNQSTASFAAYGQMLVQATAQATAFNATVEGLDRYANKARELRMQTQDMATGFERITAALKNQTVEGHNARIAIEQLGVSIAGVGADRPDLLVQRIADKLRDFRTSAGTLAAGQQIFGPGFDAQALIGLQSQPYIPFRQAQQTEIERTSQSQRDAIAAANQRRDTQTQRFNDQRTDLASNYIQDPTLVGRVLGFNPVGDIMRLFTQSQQEQADELKRIRALPEEQRRQYTPFSTQLGDAAQTGWLGRTYRQFTSGDFSSQQSEIASRYTEDRKTQSILGALATRFGREIQTLPGIQSYQPQTADTRRVSPYETYAERQAAATTLGEFGDQDPLNLVNAREALRRFNPGGRDAQGRLLPAGGENLERYQRLYGSAEGQRRFTAREATMQQNVLYAQDPSQQIADQTSRQQLLMGLRPEERAQAEFGLQYITNLRGAASANLPVGTGLQGITNAGILSPDEQRRGQAAFRTQVGRQMQEGTEETQKQIDFNKQLATELERGRAAAEDYTRAYTAYNDALMKGATHQEADQKAIEAVNLALQQRVTQGKAVTEQLKLENEFRQESIEQARRNANADPISRRVQEINLGIEQSIRREIAAGTLPNPAGGQFRDPVTGEMRTAMGPAEAAGAADARRQQLRLEQATQGVQGAQGITEATQQQVHDQQAIVDLMAKQGLSQEKAAEVYKTQQQFIDKIAQAEQDASGEALKRVEAEMRATEEYRRQADITKNIADNLQAAREAAQGAETEQVVRGAPVGDQPFLRRFLGTVDRTQQAGAGGSAYSVNNLTGLKVVGGGGFRQFQTQEASIEASIGQFQLNRSRGYTTLSQLIHRWADPDPRAAQEVATVAAKTGIGANDPVDTSDPGVMNKVMQALAEIESGKQIDPGVVTRGTQMAFHQPVTPAPATVPAPAPAAPGTAGAAQGVTDQTLLQRIGKTREEGTQIAMRALEDLRAGREIDLSYLHLPKASEDALRQAISQSYRQIVETEGTQVANAGQELANRLAGLGRQGALAGQPGAQRIAGLTPNLSIADPAARQRDLEQRQQEARAQQTLAGQNLLAGGRQNITDQQRLLEASSGSLAGYTDRMQKAAAAIQSENEARQNALGPLEQEARRRQILEEALTKQRMAQNEQTKALQEEDEIQQALNARGPFASASDLRRTASAARLAQEARDNPELAATPEFQRRQAAEGAHQNALDATERMNELRDAAHGAESAIGDAFEAMVTRGEKGVDVAKRLGGELANIALKTFVMKPMERFMDSMMSSLFGGGTPEGTAKNTIAGGVPGAPGGAANDNSILGKVGGVALGAVGLGGASSANGMPIDTGVNAVRVTLVSSMGQTGGALDKLIGQAGDDVSGTVTGKAGGSGGSTMLGRLFHSVFGGGSSDGSGGNAVDEAMARSAGKPPSVGSPPSSGGGLFGGLFDSIGKLFSGSGSSSSSKSGDGIGGWLKDFPGGMLDKMFGKDFYSGGGLIGSLFGGSSGSGGGADPSGGLGGLYARGGVFGPGAALAHFENQIIDRPTVFRFASGGAVGMMGEAGAEAVIPLRRGADGKLGVTAPHMNGPSVVMNIHTPDANSFKASQSQINSKAAAHLQTNNMRNATH